MCFQPYAKKTVLMKYNFTISDFVYTRIPEQNMTFEELSDELFYQINRDFYLYYDFQNLTLGENPKFIVEKLKTFRSGLCYKITPTYFPSLLKSEWQYFSIGFNTGTYGNLSLEDVPKVSKINHFEIPALLSCERGNSAENRVGKFKIHILF